ncbi:uncharacterized protein LOC135713934 [Ochlerotatus camptorhynchus]|uniref:uncharacterized protein LOC135713934 n=1 Tax=Ochlerotatus camptorhynchus TaxID=644619 RepID=UPI0031DFEAEF
MSRRENTFRVDYSQFPKLLTHDEIHKFVGKELGLSRENVLQLQPSRRLGCTFVKVNSLELAEKIVEQHDGKHEFVFDGKSYKLRITMEDGAVEVKFLELPEGISNDQVAAFLADYGEVISVRDLLWDDRYSDFGGVKTGVRVARMVVTKNIPSLVTIQGEETAVGYKGQRQTCLHCREFAHIGIPCVQNKKLLVQKLEADQSYANVTKGKPTPTKPTPTKPTPTKPTPTKPPHKPSPNPSDLRKPPIVKPGPSGLPQNLTATSETRAVAAQQKSTMLPPAAPVAAQQKSTTAQAVVELSPISIPIGPIVLNRRTDGNETDSSQASQLSNSSRRSSRRPPGKKMRHSGENTTTTAEHGHGQISDEDMQQ